MLLCLGLSVVNFFTSVAVNAQLQIHNLINFNHNCKCTVVIFSAAVNVSGEACPVAFLSLQDFGSVWRITMTLVL